MKKSKCKFFLIIPLLLSLSTLALAAVELPTVYIAPMENDYDAFITAALLERKVPLRIIADPDRAHYIIAGAALEGSDEWYDRLSGPEGDADRTGIRLLKSEDRSVALTVASKGDARSARRIARKLKNFLKKKAREDVANARKRAKEEGKRGPVLKIRAAARSNNDNPLMLDLVMVKDSELLTELLKMGANGWFELRNKYRQLYPNEKELSIKSFEVVPEQELTSGPLPSHKKYEGAIIFANYLSSRGQQAFMIDLRESVVVSLGEVSFTVKFGQ